VARLADQDDFTGCLQLSGFRDFGILQIAASGVVRQHSRRVFGRSWSSPPVRIWDGARRLYQLRSIRHSGACVRCPWESTTGTFARSCLMRGKVEFTRSILPISALSECSTGASKSDTKIPEPNRPGTRLHRAALRCADWSCQRASRGPGRAKERSRPLRLAHSFLGAACW
jgi:hypothetical protein